MTNKPPPQTEELSPYQLDVLAWLAVGCNYEEVAEKLSKSRPAIASAADIVRVKLGARNTAHAVYVACQRKILTIE